MRPSLEILDDRGEQVVLVTPGGEFERVRHPRVPPRSGRSLGLPKAHRRHSRRTGSMPARIVYLWSLARGDTYKLLRPALPLSGFDGCRPEPDHSR